LALAVILVSLAIGRGIRFRRDRRRALLLGHQSPNHGFRGAAPVPPPPPVPRRSARVACVFKLLKRNRVECHAFELIFKNHPQVTVTREEDFVPGLSYGSGASRIPGFDTRKDFRKTAEEDYFDVYKMHIINSLLLN
jgi:hypothetical protein